MNKERFLRLIEIMKNVEPKAFDMDDWSYKTDCGTVACIGGHAAFDPEFNDQGLNTAHKGTPMFPRDNGYTAYGEVAMAEFLEIPYRDSSRLFIRSANDIRTPMQAVTMLQEYYDAHVR